MAKVISQLPSGSNAPKHNNLLGLNEGDYLHLTQFEKAKLDGIQSGAEVNVNADWNAISGDAQILNKPTSFPPSTHTHTISKVINLQNELNSKENISNKVNTISGNSSTEYPTEKAVVDYVSSQIGADFAKVVYFDNVTPNVASIFDLNNPPLVNDPSLKEDVANLYIGTDASTWVYITSPAGYVTKTVTSSGSNFYITGTDTDAGSIKTGSITKKGQFVIDSGVIDDSGLTLEKTESSVLKTDSLGKVVKTTNLQDVEYAPIAHTHTVSQITDFPTFKTIENQSIIGAGNIDLDKASVGLENVDNTSDLLKPISTATQTALNAKANISGQVFTGAVSATNLSGTNTGDNAPNSLYSGLISNATHTGDVTGATALTIANGVVTNSKLASVATATIKGRVTAGSGIVENLNASQVRTLLNVADGANNYTHPANHPASIITQDASNRFVTDTEKSAWNAKEPAIASGTISQYWRGDKTWQDFPTIQTVDNTPTDGSNNAVSSNGVFDALALKAPLASPSLTGTPTAPTATAGTNTTQVATTAFVTNGIATADGGNVKLTGNQNVGGIKTFGSTIFFEVIPNYISILNNQSSISDNGNFGVHITRRNELISLLSSTSSTKEASLNTSSFTADRAFIFPNQDGTFALTSNPTSITATSFIKSSAPTTNLLLAGGGDIAQSIFQPAITGLTTNYLPKWNGSGFGNSGFYEDATGLNINGDSKGITFDNPKLGAVVKSSGIIHKIDGVNKWSINVGAGDGSENYNIYSFDTFKRLVSYKKNGNIEFIPDGGRALFNTTTDNGVDQVQVNGTISASPATTANQVPTWGQVQAVAKPYKVYTALLTQTGTNAPTIIVLENTLGATISMARQNTGHYRTTISIGNFPANKTFKFIQNGNYTITKQQILTAAVQVNTPSFDMYTEVDGVKTDNVLQNAAYEIRIYP